MKILIIGAGRMGQRHASGAAMVDRVSQVMLADISTDALDAAKNSLATAQHAEKFAFCLTSDDAMKNQYDIVIIAATAKNRMELCEWAVRTGAAHILVEKPLGQSMQETTQLAAYFQGQKHAKAYVNLNMRVYPDSQKLKKDLTEKPQLAGRKNISINTGTVGIGANGIHYLDYLFFLTDADRAKLLAADIDDTTIPSARGAHFRDFGGWCSIQLLKKDAIVAHALLSVSPHSTVFGGWDIVCPHGRITINESTGKRIDYLRKENSEMPIQRYNADYMAPVETAFDSPFLGDLTRLWIEELINGRNLLPEIHAALPAHQLMFDWLAFSKSYSDQFPIT
jgi:predicted dehydrogenase